MIDLEQLANNIGAALPNVKSGPIRLWGQSMGRPGENWHVLVGCTASNDCLRLIFTDDEILAVWNPRGIEIDAQRFRIASADAMRLTSYYQGRPMTPENILYRDYALHDGLVLFRTNEPWLCESGYMPEATVATFLAVEVGE